MAVKPIPDGYHSVTPYLYVRGASDAIEFYKKAFGATERMRLEMRGKIGHAEIQIGDSAVMLADEVPQMGVIGPQSLNGTSVGIMVYVEGVDAAFARAVAAGATVHRPVQDQFYGDRSGSLIDPFGHHWTLGTHKEDLTNEQLQARMEDAMKKMPAN